MNRIAATAFHTGDDRVAPQGEDHCAILLGLFNGARDLSEQLLSFSDQTHTDWSLIVSDDGSTDAGCEMLRRFAEAHPERDIRLVEGPGRGFAANFLSLFDRIGPEARFAALSDQDDRWLPGKLRHGIAQLQTVGDDRPALYCGRTIICDAALRPLRRSPHFKLPPGFAHALVQNIAGGNTMVLNRRAIELVRASIGRVGPLPAHDWWIYQLVTAAGGVVLYDREPMVLYRQHVRNLIGASDGFSAQMTRLRGLLSGRFAVWNGQNLAALRAMDHCITPQNRAVLAHFSTAREGRPAERLRALAKSGVYRQTRKGTIALWLAAALKRL